MAGERKKPTAAEKGKAIAVEEKKRDKGLEAALNATRAAHRRPAGIVINEPTTALRRSERVRTSTAPTSTVPTGLESRGTPGSRKRARDDDEVPLPRAAPHLVPPTTTHLVPPTAPPPPPIVDEDNYLECFSRASRSVVTVAFDMCDGQTTVTSYRTGFILIDEENYSMVLTTAKPFDGKVDNYFIYFEGENSRTEAYKFETIEEENLLLLIVRSEKRHGAVTLSSDSLGYEVIFTVCAMSDRKLNAKANAPVLKDLEGRLGLYKGTVATPNCHALNACGEHIVGSENYFQLGFTVHDDIITLANVDAKRHTSEIAVSAPVFCLNGKTAGIIFSEGGWPDFKVGLLATRIIFCLQTKFGRAEWEESIKEDAESWLKRT